MKRDSGGNYYVDVYFINRGGIGIPKVEFDSTYLGNAYSSAPGLPTSFQLFGGSYYKVTCTYPSSAGSSGQIVTLSVNGRTLDDFSNITGFFTTNFLDVKLP